MSTVQNSLEHHRHKVDVLVAIQRDGPVPAQGLKLFDLRVDFASQLGNNPHALWMAARQQ